MKYPTMLYLNHRGNYRVVRDKDEYDALIKQGYKTHDEVDDKPEPVAADVTDALKQAYDYIETLENDLESLKQKLAVYETAKDTNNDGKVSYDELTVQELQVLLKQRGVSFKARDSKTKLIKLAKDSE